MEKLIFHHRYDREMVLDTFFDPKDQILFKRNRGFADREMIIQDVKDFSEYARLDIDILENEQELIFRFYFYEDVFLNDLGLDPLERIIACCDQLSVRKGNDEFLEGILELRYLLNE